jgi:hypothetical protein
LQITDHHHITHHHRYEQSHSISFDWFVLIRLDAAWNEPVLPIHKYANDRVWVTETGFVPINDQFMLIPRQFSDHLFSLDAKVQKGVYCLGGPDVEETKCNEKDMRRRGILSDLQINQTLDCCCSDVLDKMKSNGRVSTHH